MLNPERMSCLCKSPFIRAIFTTILGAIFFPEENYTNIAFAVKFKHVETNCDIAVT